MTMPCCSDVMTNVEGSLCEMVTQSIIELVVDFGKRLVSAFGRRRRCQVRCFWQPMNN
jgi:hypothetical protein